MIRKKVVAFISVIIAFLLQTTVFPSFALSDVVPNILLAVTVSYAYLRGRTSGMLIGFFCGILLDMVCGTVIGLYALAFITIGFVVGFCQKFYFRESIALPIALIVISDLAYGFYYYITEFLMRGRLHFGFYFIHRILPEVIYTLIIGIAFYYLIAMIDKSLQTKREEV